MEPWDVIIVGQGLAGTTLSWHLTQAGQRVLLIDAEAPVTSSKIAAGLITPITGRRLALSWRVDEFWPAARAFYTRIEAHTAQSFFHDRTAIRLFQSDAEANLWAKKRMRPAIQAHLLNPAPNPLLDPAICDATGGGFAMHAAQLDAPAYLKASREHLPTAHMTLDWSRDVRFGPDDIWVGTHRTRRLISCEGYAAAHNPYFAWVPFKAAKGDILTVRFHQPVPPISLHGGIWIAPTATANEFRVGSTYDWAQLDEVPSAGARAALERKLKALVHVPYTVLDHQAAVRPIIRASRPVLGLHPAQDRLGFFNGLGSKGALLAPWFANLFTQHLLLATLLPEDCDLRQKGLNVDACD